MYIHSEANNILHRFNNDNPTLNIIVEIAHDHQKEYVPIENDEYEFLDKPMMIEDNAAMRNVLDMNSRYGIKYIIIKSLQKMKNHCNYNRIQFETSTIQDGDFSTTPISIINNS